MRNGLLVLALGFLALPVAAGDKASEKAGEEARLLQGYLEGQRLPSKKLEETVEAYREYRDLPASGRKQVLDQCIAERAARSANKEKGSAKAGMNAKGWGPGSGLGAKGKAANMAHNQVTKMRIEDPKGYEALVRDPEKRIELLKRNGIAEDELYLVQDYVFGDLKDEEAFFRVRDELAALGLDGQDAYWLFDRLPMLGKADKASEEEEEGGKKKEGKKGKK